MEAHWQGFPASLLASVELVPLVEEHIRVPLHQRCAILIMTGSSDTLVGSGRPPLYGVLERPCRV